MKINILLLFVCLIFGFTNAQLDQVDVISSEMEEDMEKFAVGQTLVLLSMQKDLKVVATKLVELMNQRYGNEWVTLIGTNLHTTIIGLKMIKNTKLLLEYKDSHVLLVRQELSVEKSNVTMLESIIQRAKSAPIKKIATTNQGNFDRFSNLAKQVILNEHGSCDSETNSTDFKNWCYKMMGQELVDAINNLNDTRGTFTATIGNNNRCFSETIGLNITEAHLFTLDDIYFEITKYIV